MKPVPRACLSVWCCLAVMLPSVIPHYSSVSCSPQTATSHQTASWLAMDPGKTENHHTNEKRWLILEHSVHNVSIAQGISSIHLMTPHLWGCSRQRDTFLLKLVIWWHWSPSHPSISAESVRLIGGGGVLANSSTTFLVPDQKLFGGPTCLFDLLHSSGHHRLLLNVIKWIFKHLEQFYTPRSLPVLAIKAAEMEQNAKNETQKSFDDNI